MNFYMFTESNSKLTKVYIWTSHRELTLVVYLFGGVKSSAKNSKVAHEYTEHREHDEFILVRVSRD
jgi:hypothetical protein